MRKWGVREGKSTKILGRLIPSRLRSSELCKRGERKKAAASFRSHLDSVRFLQMNHGGSSLSRERLRMAEDNKIQSRGRARRPHKAESERLPPPPLFSAVGKGERKSKT